MTSDLQSAKQPTMTRKELLTIIDQAAREQWIQLQIFDRGISELPDEIGQLTKLEELNLSHNLLTTLPEAIGQLTNLQSLALDANQLIAFPKSIGQLIK